MRLKKLYLIFFALLQIVSVFSQKSTWLDKQIDLTQLEVRKDSFQMVQHGKVVGHWIWETDVTEKEIVMKDVSVLTDVIKEEFVLKMDKADMVSKSVAMKMEGNGFSLRADIERNSNLDLNGSFVINKGTIRKKQIDTTYSSNVILRPEIFGLIYTMPDLTKLDEKVNAFILSSATSYQMNLRYIGEEMVSVPAGTFNCGKIAFENKEGQAVSNIIYITKRVPQRIVKVDVLGQDMTIELTKT